MPAAADPARAGHDPANPPITMLLSLRRFSPTVYTPRYVATPRAMKPEVRGLSRNHASTMPVAMRTTRKSSTYCSGAESLHGWGLGAAMVDSLVGALHARQ